MTRMRSRSTWVWLLCSLTGTLLIAMPDPDRRLFSISETHGPGVADLIGAVVLTTGWLVLDRQIWLGRRRLLAMRRRRLLALVLIALAGAVIVAFSVRRDAGMWWLLGAALLAGAQVIAAAAVVADSGSGRPSGMRRRRRSANQPSPAPHRVGRREEA